MNTDSPTYPIFLARNAWFETDEGKHCKELAEDCLTLAFVAGWRAALTEMERKVSELETK